MLERCWEGEPTSRPCFAEILAFLEEVKETTSKEKGTTSIDTRNTPQRSEESAKNQSVEERTSENGDDFHGPLVFSETDLVRFSTASSPPNAACAGGCQQVHDEKSSNHGQLVKENPGQIVKENSGQIAKENSGQIVKEASELSHEQKRQKSPSSEQMEESTPHLTVWLL